MLSSAINTQIHLSSWFSMRSFRLTLYVFHSCSLDTLLVFSASAAGDCGFSPGSEKPLTRDGWAVPLPGDLWSLWLRHTVTGLWQLGTAALRALREGVLPCLWSPRGCRLTVWVLLTRIHTSGRDWRNDPQGSAQDHAPESFWRLSWECGCLRHRALDGLCRTTLGYLNLINGSMPLVFFRCVKD